MSPNANLTSEGGHGQEEPNNGSSIVDYEASDDAAGNAKATRQNNVRQFIGVVKLKDTLNIGFIRDSVKFQLIQT